MKRRTKHLSVRDGTLIPMGNNFAYVLGDHPNKVDDVDIGPNNINGLSVNHGEIMQFGGNGVRVFSAEPILGGISPSRLVQAGMNPNTVFAAQEKYKDIHHLKDDGSHAKFGDWIRGLFGKKQITTAEDTPEYYGGDIEPAVVTAALPAKFNGSQTAATKYVEGYKFGRKIAKKRDDIAKNVVNKILPTDLNNDLDNNALGFTPIIGDALQGAQGIRDIAAGNYLKGAVGLGMLAVPNIIEKPLKSVYRLGKIAIDGGLGKFINTIPSKRIKQLNSLNINDIRKSVIDYQQFRDLERDATTINPYIYTNIVKIRPSSRYETILNYLGKTKSNVGNTAALALNAGNEIILFPGGYNKGIIGHELRHSIHNDLAQYYNRDGIPIPGQSNFFEKIDSFGKSISINKDNPTPISSIILSKNKSEWFKHPDEFDAELEYFRQKFAPNTTYKELIKGKNDSKSRYTKIVKGLKRRFNITSKEVDTIMKELYNAGFKLGGIVNNKKLGGIHIAPSKRGTFTAAAKQHGMGVQAFASRVLANKSNYSSAMVKKANFARNASRWHHALGGEEIITPNYAILPLQGNPLYDITGETKYKSDDLDNPESRKFILDALWAMENPYGKGLNKDGTYSSYGDPNGEDQDVGPGILLSNLPSKDSYTKQELEDYAYARVLAGRNKIRQSFDAKYGEGEYDKLDDTRKYIMDDVRYRYGTVAQSEWPNLYQAIYDNDIINALINARTTFKNKKGEVIGWDNNRIENLAKYFYPDIVVEHKGNKDTYLKVYKKK